MELSEEEIEKEHRDFLRKIANEVYELVRDQTNMARFRSQVKIFCEKNEEHQKEVELLKKASSNDPKLHNAIKKKEKVKWGKTKEEMTLEEINKCYPISFCTRKLEGEKHYVYHEYLKDIDDNNCYHYNSFWGIPAKTAGLLDFLITPPLRRDDFEQYYWDFGFSKQPDDNERTICFYALLTAVHDIQVSDKPIFHSKIYNGSWVLRNKWKNILWKICIGSTWSSIPSCRIEGLTDIRAWIQRSLADVKVDLDRIRTEESNQKAISVRKEFTNEEDQKLFIEIGVDIKKHQDKYREAGKWLDKFYDVSNFWKLTEQHFKKIADTKRNLEEDPGYCAQELLIELALWTLMIKLRIYMPINQLKKIYESKSKNTRGEIEAYEGYTVEDGKARQGFFFTEEKVSEAIENRLEVSQKFEDGVPIKYRLLKACTALLKSGEFLSLEQAKRICLITWFLTDPDADKAKLNLTHSEKWPWKNKLFGSSDREVVFSLLDKNKENWVYFVRLAWDKVEAEKDLESEKSIKIEKKIKTIEEPPPLNDTEQNIVDALGTKTLIGEELAKKAGYPYNSNFKSTLASLRKRGILGNKSPGYFVEPKYHFLINKSD